VDGCRGRGTARRTAGGEVETPSPRDSSCSLGKVKIFPFSFFVVSFPFGLVVALLLPHPLLFSFRCCTFFKLLFFLSLSLVLSKIFLIFFGTSKPQQHKNKLQFSIYPNWKGR